MWRSKKIDRGLCKRRLPLPIRLDAARLIFLSSFLLRFTSSFKFFIPLILDFFSPLWLYFFFPFLCPIYLYTEVFLPSSFVFSVSYLTHSSLGSASSSFVFSPHPYHIPISLFFFLFFSTVSLCMYSPVPAWARPISHLGNSGRARELWWPIRISFDPNPSLVFSFCWT